MIGKTVFDIENISNAKLKVFRHLETLFIPCYPITFMSVMSDCKKIAARLVIRVTTLAETLTLVFRVALEEGN